MSTQLQDLVHKEAMNRSMSAISTPLLPLPFPPPPSPLSIHSCEFTSSSYTFVTRHVTAISD